MADDETEQTPAASSDDAPASAEPETAQSTDSPQGASSDDAAAVSEAPAADDAEETPDAPEAEAPATAVADAPAEPAEPAEPQEQLAPKERRARARAAKAAKTAPSGPRTGEERQAARDERRAGAARERRASREKARVKYKSEAHSRTATPPREHVAGRQKVRQGVVVSDSADKTITVRIDVARRHRKYMKIVRTSTKLHAHDERNDAHLGDTVTIRESRPLSRSKRWRLVDVVERAK